ncbi:MAG: hypothetical protein ACFCD0_01165 [Gemmataceae bacterium]
MKAMFLDLRQRFPWVLAMTLIGGLSFVWAQVLVAEFEIASALGQRVVKAGEYKQVFAAPIGWTTHLAISFSYALLFAVLLSVPFFPKEQPKRLLVGFVLAVVLGWFTTVITGPAVSATVSLLAGQGIPENFSPLYFGIDIFLYVHVGFFVLAWLLVGWAADCFKE